MASRTTFLALVASAGLWLAAMAAPVAAIAGGCGCTPPPPPPPPTPCCAPSIVVPGVNVYVAPSVNVNVNAQAQASATAVSGATAQTETLIGGGGISGIMPGPVTSLSLNMGGSERQAYEATRTRIEKVAIQAFCFDDKDVPHPASQVQPERDIDASYDGEVYRCIAGTHMQVTIAPWAEHISFAGGKTIICRKGEALYHSPGPEGGVIACRTQIPERQCNERSLLRRFGAGIKVMTLVVTERYTAYRESHGGGVTTMSLDGGVGGIVY